MYFNFFLILQQKLTDTVTYVKSSSCFVWAEITNNLTMDCRIIEEFAEGFLETAIKEAGGTRGVRLFSETISDIVGKYRLI